MGNSHGMAEAKARLSEIVERAQVEGPQQITRRGRPAAYVVAAAEWQRQTERRGNLAEFLRDSPLRGSGIESKRIPGRLRTTR